MPIEEGIKTIGERVEGVMCIYTYYFRIEINLETTRHPFIVRLEFNPKRTFVNLN